MDLEKFINLPPIPEDPRGQENDDCRLWIGNLDLKLTEFNLLKVLQKIGTLKKFDFLYHKAGPDVGKPRGYCFVSYATKDEAEKAQKALHGKHVLSKRLIVRHAHTEQKDDKKKNNQTESKSNISTNVQIQAIEAKLRMMEHGEDLSSFSDKPCTFVPRPLMAECLASSTTQGHKTYQHGGHSHHHNHHHHTSHKRHHPHSKPYSKPLARR